MQDLLSLYDCGELSAEVLTLLSSEHGGAKMVGPVAFRSARQSPEGILKPFAQGFEALAEADLDVLPVRVGQDKMVQQVWK